MSILDRVVPYSSGSQVFKTEIINKTVKGATPDLTIKQRAQKIKLVVLVITSDNISPNACFDSLNLHRDGFRKIVSQCKIQQLACQIMIELPK